MNYNNNPWNSKKCCHFGLKEQVLKSEIFEVRTRYADMESNDPMHTRLKWPKIVDRSKWNLKEETLKMPCRQLFKFRIDKKISKTVRILIYQHFFLKFWIFKYRVDFLWYCSNVRCLTIQLFLSSRQTRGYLILPPEAIYSLFNVLNGLDIMAL